MNCGVTCHNDNTNRTGQSVDMNLRLNAEDPIAALEIGDRPATEAYVTRATDRPSFRKARADQIAHFEAADEKRTENGSG